MQGHTPELKGVAAGFKCHTFAWAVPPELPACVSPHSGTTHEWCGQGGRAPARVRVYNYGNTNLGIHSPARTCVRASGARCSPCMAEQGDGTAPPRPARRDERTWPQVCGARASGSRQRCSRVGEQRMSEQTGVPRTPWPGWMGARTSGALRELRAQPRNSCSLSRQGMGASSASSAPVPSRRAGEAARCRCGVTHPGGHGWLRTRRDGSGWMAPTEEGVACHKTARRHGRGHRPRSSAEPGLWHSAARSDASVAACAGSGMAKAACAGCVAQLRGSGGSCGHHVPQQNPSFGHFPPRLGRGTHTHTHTHALRGGLRPQSLLHISCMSIPPPPRTAGAGEQQ